MKNRIESPGCCWKLWHVAEAMRNGAIHLCAKDAAGEVDLLLRKRHRAQARHKKPNGHNMQSGRPGRDGACRGPSLRISGAAVRTTAPQNFRLNSFWAGAVTMEL